MPIWEKIMKIYQKRIGRIRIHHH